MQAQHAAAGGAASAATNLAAQPAEPASTAAAASDAHKGGSGSNAASTATAKPTTRASSRSAPAKSKSQEIPKGRTTASQRMTRAAAARVAAELADTAPGSVMEEEEEEEEMDEDMAEGPGPDYDMVKLSSMPPSSTAAIHAKSFYSSPMSRSPHAVHCKQLLHIMPLTV